MSARVAKSLPSSSSMKSGNLWGTASDHAGADLSLLAEQITDRAPPLDISPRFTKRFNLGEVVEPFDFSHHRVNMDQMEYSKKRKLTEDPFERLGIDPSTLYALPEVLSLFLSSSGQILPRSVTGCSAKNQKKLLNAIKTARACGVLLSTHRYHDELLTRNL